MFRSLPIHLVLFLLELTSLPRGIHSSNIISRTIHTTHQIASRHTKVIARDLRLAFGAVLVSEATQQSLNNSRTVYCKSSAAPGSSGLGSSGGQGNSSSGSSGSSSQGTSTSTKSAAAGSSTASAVSTPWKLVEAHNGSDFFQGWSFFTGSDPTHGVVDYLDENDASSAGLAYVNSAGNAVMAVDTTNNLTGNRKSVRITTNSQYSQGIWILDALHMPTGCGTWPAFWTNGPNWPAGGEIDIVEGVNDYTNNQATIHTNPGCTISSSNSTVLGITGTVVGGTNCAAAETGNQVEPFNLCIKLSLIVGPSSQGCGVRSSSDVSFGAAFNNNGGGVYASKLDDTGVSIYFWPTGQVPSDVLAGTPNPALTAWGTPLAQWSSSGCNPSTFFSDHSAIFDTTFCGDWAGEVWTTSGIPGQEQSCAQRTGYSTCEAFVMAEGSAFTQAYWEVQSVKIYQYQP
ncbi:glycoside hydrolase family 16 protein [Lentinula detonsa]|uniref:Glycoside hydrolase family 16 protein n=1 Tax=Lentinula detonsa TaxID=2804962 RepID=A0A9W8U3M0_9AGAR|nr:glycoside hydrolase family 16 protein [Lentinula detonsa]